MGQKCVSAGSAASLDEAVLGEGWKMGHHTITHPMTLNPSSPQSLKHSPSLWGDTLWVSHSWGGCLILALDPSTEACCPHGHSRSGTEKSSPKPYSPLPAWLQWMG